MSYPLWRRNIDVEMTRLKKCLHLCIEVMDSYRFQKYLCESELNEPDQNSNKMIRFLEMCQNKDISTSHRTYYITIHLFCNILVTNYM